MHKSDQMYEKRWGVFAGCGHEAFNNPADLRSLGRETSWDDCLRDFNCETFAGQLAEIGAGYVIFTLAAQSRFLPAPNSTFNKVTGYAPGEACASFDFISLLADALAEREIDLFLSFSGDGPTADDHAAACFQTINHTNGYISAVFNQLWSGVLEEYSRLYGRKISGWYLDRMYSVLNYEAAAIETMVNACRAGNPDAVVACDIHPHVNCGIPLRHIRRGAQFDDFAAGRLAELADLPYAPMIAHTRWHTLSFLGVPEESAVFDGWGCPGVRYTLDYLNRYVSKVRELGGVVSIDVCVYRDGSIDAEQLETLSVLKNI